MRYREKGEDIMNRLNLKPLPGRKFKNGNEILKAFFQNEDFLLCTMHGQNIICKKDLEKLAGEQKEIIIPFRKGRIRIELGTAFNI